MKENSDPGWQRAEVFQSGDDRAVRLPDGVLTESTEVRIACMGDGVVLLPGGSPWQPLFDSLAMFSDDFIEDRDQDAGRSFEATMVDRMEAHMCRLEEALALERSEADKLRAEMDSLRAEINKLELVVKTIEGEINGKRGPKSPWRGPSTSQ